MKIIRLFSENYKKIKCVDITPNGHVVSIRGRNGAGKSSAIDSIVAAFKGKSAAPDMPIREGQEKATIIVKTDAYTVTRKFTESGCYLEVTNADGAVLKSPQGLLDRMVGDIAFDPLKFCNLPAKDQRAALIELIGVDVSQYDSKINECREYRKELLAEKKRASDELLTLTYVENLPVEEVSVIELSRQLNDANKHNNAYETQKQNLQRQRQQLAQQQQQLKALLAQVEQAKAAIKQTEGQIATVESAIATTKPVDVTGIEAQIESAEGTNRMIRENARYVQAKDTVETLAAQITDAHHATEAAELEKAQALAAIEMPVEGLSVTESCVTYNGIPLAQVNHAKRLQIGMAIQMAMNPKLRVILIDGNGLDEETRATILETAEKHDFQVWEETTDSSGKVGIVIEEGSVVAVDGKPIEPQTVTVN